LRDLDDLERRLESVQALLANVPDPVLLIDAQGVVREANGAARTLLPALRIGQPLFYAVRAPEILDAVAAAPGRTGSVYVEYHERVPTERTFEVQIGALAATGTGRPGNAGVMLFFRDLTAARRLERMRVDFVANASHELRTPLASVLGFIETLQGPARDDPVARDRFLDIMRQQAQRMTRLIDDLLSLSRIELRAHVPPETAVDLRSIVMQMIDSLAPLGRERGVEVRLEADEGALTVRGDRDELLRVVENLVENAVKYGSGGRRVDIALHRQPGREGGQIVLSVRDYGPGIAPEHLPRLTERFYRVDVTASREQGGTGLGLAIVKHIVNRHRGRLHIESELGEGATFRVLLPEHGGSPVM
jgi:two-component system, OmpR family, phosphate regulon sensor histidine kinase PhoR